MSPTERGELGEAVCARLAEEIRKLGFAGGGPVYAEAGFSRAKDPYSGEDSLVGVWRDARGGRLGEIKFHGDGSFYAEYDVALPHPRDGRWFVEAVVAWGRDGLVKSEARLLRAPG